MQNQANHLLQPFIREIENVLLPNLTVYSQMNHEPVVYQQLPFPWQWVGSGNYAVVVMHPTFTEFVVKVYARDQKGIEDEIAVYNKLGNHPTFSTCYAYGERYLILRRLSGLTLYDCVIQGVRVEKQVMLDVQQALEDARQLGLYPHDVHGKNILMHNGRGYIVDVSDFYKQEPCRMWDDLLAAYHRIYLRTLYVVPLPVPPWLMNLVRKGYRFFRKK